MKIILKSFRKISLFIDILYIFSVLKIESNIFIIITIYAKINLGSIQYGTAPDCFLFLIFIKTYHINIL